ncbi:sigma-70 family RNA polymerase sigma factor [Sulfurivirga sp.]|uniref:sigma-70 family RNA polymerase sigma factor n=1 Tax=Sulfurivirga sp. TaxID=2614236 RepID=UPI0025D68B02|nr:sigma-70 family RNA polymerase sigma factor [Sulfurivirga sp.]
MTSMPSAAELTPDEVRRWVDAWGDRLYQYAVLQCGDREAAADLVQETFVAAWRQRAAWSGHGSPYSWLRGILHHKIQDWWRMQQRLREQVDDRVDPLEAELFDSRGHWAGASADLSPETLCERDDFWRWLEACLEQLPALQAAVFRQAELTPAQREEICQRLGITNEHLRVLLYRARLRLRTCLANAGFTSEEGS